MRLILSYLVLFVTFSATLTDPALADPKKVTPDPRYQGKVIRNITVKVKEIFDESEIGAFYRAANDLKIQTKENVVMRELLFKSGDTYDEFLVRESERNLRTLRFLRNVTITPTADGNFVDLTVVVQDTWTLIPQFAFSSGTGKNKKAVGLAESNVLGYGKRLEALYEEDDSRESIEGVWDDNRVFGSYHELLAGYFHRTDGDRIVLDTGRPFRSLVERESWRLFVDSSDSVGRLWKDSEEEYIFRQKISNADIRYTIAEGNPEILVRRYSLGYGFIKEDFNQADLDDYEDLDLDPSEVSNDPERLSENRTFSGPALSLERIEPEFVSMNYIDRFDRVEDYNLGEQSIFNALIAPDFLGSNEDTLLLSGTYAGGNLIDPGSFLRGEITAGSRLGDDSLDNSIISAELKYFNVLSPISVGDFYIGRHTLAANFFIDYAERLDENRQFLLGGDNGLRGYKARTFTGDKRFSINVEDRIHFIDDAFKLVSVGAAVFVEAGAASDAALGRMITDEIYSDFGAGLRFAFPRSSGGRVFRIDVAFPMRDGADGSKALEPRIIFAGAQLFGARTRSESQGNVRANLATGVDN